MANIVWYPGHMKKGLDQIMEKVALVDLVIIMLDGRAPFSSINEEFDKLSQNKLKLIVVSKVDLCDRNFLNTQLIELRKCYEHVIPLKVNDPKTKKKLTDEIDMIAEAKRVRDKSRGMKTQPIKTMVLGIPNVGKSSLINRLVSKKIAPVANIPAYTRGNKWVRINDNIHLLDTPGILPTSFSEERVGINLALIGSIRESILPNYDLCVYLIDYLKQYYPSSLKERFGIESITTYTDVINQICLNRHLVTKSNEPDIARAESLLLKEFKDGLLGKISLER
ncbi:MAG: ribosome biogenesis GTPase YlqF [Coprobacillus sp.]|nr:ribosome biogenesis GTPase YlqF [Coprobacillus sp.]